MTVTRMPEPIPPVGDVEIDTWLDTALRGTPKKRDLALRAVRRRIEELLAERNDALEAVRRGPGAAAMAAVVQEREAEEREARAEAERSATADRFTEELARVFPALGVQLHLRETIASRLGDALTYPSTWRLPDGLTDALSEVARVARAEASEAMDEELRGEIKEANEQRDAMEATHESVAAPAHRLAAAFLAIVGIVDRDGDNAPARRTRADAERILRQTSGVCWTAAVGEYEAAWRDGR